MGGGREEEDIFSGCQSTKKGGISLLCTRGFTEGVRLWVVGEREDFISGHQSTKEGGGSLLCTWKFTGSGDFWVGGGMICLYRSGFFMSSNGCVGKFVSVCGVCVGSVFIFSSLLAVFL